MRYFACLSEEVPRVIHRSGARSDLNFFLHFGRFTSRHQPDFHVLFPEFLFSVHSWKFQLSWWIYQTSFTFPAQKSLQPKSGAEEELSMLVEFSAASRRCINRRQSYRDGEFYYTNSLTTRLLVNVTRFLSATSGHFRSSNFIESSHCATSRRSARRGLEALSDKYLMKTLFIVCAGF